MEADKGDFMKQILYIPSFSEMLKEYADAEDLKASYEKYGCEGLEIIRCDDRVNSAPQIAAEMIRGVHMIFYPIWLDFWNGDEQRLAAEFGSRETWEGFYMGRDREALIAQFEADLEYAQRAGAEYVVFHVSDVTIQGVFTHEHTHTDEDVAAAAVELINRLLDGKNYDFWFLMENLWWPGLTMTKPDVTKQLLDGVRYSKKGIMLDLGHLMCSNMELATEDEAIDYVLEMVRAHACVMTEDCSDQPGRPLSHFIRGIHAHQSVTGEFAKQALTHVRENGLRLDADYYGRFSQVYELLGNIDTHQPFSSPRFRELVEEIAPEYVVHELMAKSRGERDSMLAQQSALLRK